MPDLPAPAPSGWTLEKRTAIGAGLGLLCLGILIGFKAAAGAPTVIERPVFRQEPCKDCIEREIKEARVTPEPQQSVPGDSSVPED